MEGNTQMWILNNRDRYRLEAAQVRILRQLQRATKSDHLATQI
jgi:hypothetical protein